MRSRRVTVAITCQHGKFNDELADWFNLFLIIASLTRGFNPVVNFFMQKILRIAFANKYPVLSFIVTLSGWIIQPLLYRF